MYINNPSWSVNFYDMIPLNLRAPCFLACAVRSGCRLVSAWGGVSLLALRYCGLPILYHMVIVFSIIDSCLSARRKYKSLDVHLVPTLSYDITRLMGGDALVPRTGSWGP